MNYPLYIFCAFFTLGATQCADGTTCSGGCSLTQGYWKNHPEDWQSQNNNQLCGEGWLDILETPPAGGDAWLILGRSLLTKAHQYIAAALNAASGACVPDCISNNLDQAYDLLTSDECHLSSANYQTAIDLAAELDRYNNGLIGPGHCGETPTSTCLDCPGDCGCTFTQGAWKEKFGLGGNANNDLCTWPGVPDDPCHNFDWLDVDATLTESTELCGLTWSEIMTSAGGQWNALAHQTIAALLNLFNGACQKCPDVDYCNQVYGNVQTAYESLAADCTATSVNTLLIEALSSFNEGTAGVAQCTDDEAVEVIETLCEAAPDNRKRTGDQTCIRCRSTSFSAASAAYREYGMSLSTTSTLTGWVIGLACIAGVLGVALLVTSIALIRSRRAPTDPFEETE